MEALIPVQRLEVSVQPFSYDDLSPDLATEVKAAAGRLRERMKRHAEDIVFIGKELLQVKEQLGHGRFGDWLVAEFSMTDRTAQNYMNVALVFGDNISTLVGLKLGVIYELAASSTSEEVRQQVFARVEQGEQVTQPEVKALKKKLLEAESQLEAERQHVATRDEQLTQLQEEKLALERKMKSLEDEPAVYVETVPEGYDSAAEAIEAVQRELEDLERKKQALLDEVDASSDEAGRLMSLRSRITSFKDAVLDLLSKHTEAQLFLTDAAVTDGMEAELKTLASALEDLATLARGGRR